MSIFILVINKGELSLPGDNKRCSSYGYDTRHGPFNAYAKYHCSKLVHAVVMIIWNMDAWQTQQYLSSAVSCISCHFQIKYLICLIALSYYRRSLPPWYPLPNLKEITSLSPLKTFLKASSNRNMYEVTPPCYVINICILYRLYFKQHGFLKEELIG